MPVTGYTGISFPFRIGVKGGVVMSTTSYDDLTHIEESVFTLLGTRKMERWMEYHIYADLDIVVFEPNNVSLATLIDYEIREALRLEKRIEVNRTEIVSDSEYLYISILFLITAYQTYHEVKVKFNKNTGGIENHFYPMHDSNT